MRLITYYMLIDQVGTLCLICLLFWISPT